MKRTWINGLFAVAFVGAVGVGCGVAEDSETTQAPEELATEQVVRDTEVAAWPGLDDVRRGPDSSHDDQCGVKKCFDIKADKNISHVFLDFGKCKVGDFDVLAKTPFTDEYENVTDRLKTQGGPCQDLGLTYRFELRGPDRDDNDDPRTARVCVVFHDKVSEVTVGYKAADLCRAKTYDEGKCKKCQKADD